MLKSFESVITVVENMDTANLSMDLVNSKFKNEIERSKASETRIKYSQSNAITLRPIDV